jgi:hypothetical protein
MQEFEQMPQPYVAFYDNKVSVLCFTFEGARSMLARIRDDTSCDFVRMSLQKFVDDHKCVKQSVTYIVNTEQMCILLRYSSWLIKIVR